MNKLSHGGDGIVSGDATDIISGGAMILEPHQ